MCDCRVPRDQSQTLSQQISNAAQLSAILAQLLTGQVWRITVLEREYQTIDPKVLICPQKMRAHLVTSVLTRNSPAATEGSQQEVLCQSQHPNKLLHCLNAVFRESYIGCSIKYTCLNPNLRFKIKAVLWSSTSINSVSLSTLAQMQ
jgi:hypothetical protein